jgi:hypothetical protein
MRRTAVTVSRIITGYTHTESEVNDCIEMMKLSGTWNEEAVQRRSDKGENTRSSTHLFVCMIHVEQ